MGMELCRMESISTGDIRIPIGEQGVSEQIAQNCLNCLKSLRILPLIQQTCMYIEDCHVCFSLGGNKPVTAPEHLQEPCVNSEDLPKAMLMTPAP